MDSRFEAVRTMFDARFIERSPEELGAEIVDLAEVLRCQTLELERSITEYQNEALKAGYYVDTIKLRQPLYRLQQLYKQITGFEVDEFFDKIKEQQG